jgi:hypothetical protein
MWKTLRQIHRAGIATELPPSTDETLRVVAALQERILAVLGRACAFAPLTLVPATVVSWKSMRSAIHSTISKVWESGS